MALGARVVTSEIPTGDPKKIGTVSAPVWNHNAKFDVLQPGRTILMCIYDKLAKIGSPTNGFLGACIFEPDLIEDLGDEGTGFEIWVPLKSELDAESGGEVRLRILYEAAKTSPKLCVDDFQILRRIGEGSFGQVFRVRKRDTKRICMSRLSFHFSEIPSYSYKIPLNFNYIIRCYESYIKEDRQEFNCISTSPS